MGGFDPVVQWIGPYPPSSPVSIILIIIPIPEIPQVFVDDVVSREDDDAVGDVVAGAVRIAAGILEAHEAGLSAREGPAGAVFVSPTMMMMMMMMMMIDD